MQPTDWTIPERFDEREHRTIKRLLAHPDTTLVEIAGEERPFLIGRRSYRLAEKADVDPELALNFSREGQTSGESLDAYALFLWFGCVAFEPDLEPEDFADLVTITDLSRNAEASTSAVRRMMQDAAVVAEVMGDEGKPAAATDQGYRVRSLMPAPSPTSGSAPSVSVSTSSSSA